MACGSREGDRRGYDPSPLILIPFSVEDAWLLRDYIRLNLLTPDTKQARERLAEALESGLATAAMINNPSS